MQEDRTRKSLTPVDGAPLLHGMRRGDARHEASAPVYMLGPNLKIREGWVLNVSRGGVRLITEGALELGEAYEITVGEGSSRRARIVWVQEERDGTIAGLEYLFD